LTAVQKLCFGPRSQAADQEDITFQERLPLWPLALLILLLGIFSTPVTRLAATSIERQVLHPVTPLLLKHQSPPLTPVRKDAALQERRGRP